MTETAAPPPKPTKPTVADWLARAAAVTPRNEAFIDGRFVPAASGRTFSDIAGRDGRRIADVAEGGTEDIDRAVAAARRSSDDRRWADQSPASRKRVLLKLAELIRSNRDELALLESLDVGKPIRDTLSVDVPSAAKTIQWFAETIDKVYGEVGPTDAATLSLVTREPIIVYVNTFDTADITVPFGGYKQSGFGRDKSLHALEGYTQLKTTWFDLSGK